MRRVPMHRTGLLTCCMYPSSPQRVRQNIVPKHEQYNEDGSGDNFKVALGGLYFWLRLYSTA